MSWWAKPFSVTVDGEPWAVVTDKKVFLVAIRGPNKLPAMRAFGAPRTTRTGS